MSSPPHDPRAQQALFMAKGRDKRDGSVRGGILKTVFLIGIPIVAAVVVWWMFFLREESVKPIDLSFFRL